MNFASDSLKDRSNAQNASFSFDIEMPGGHFFAVLDFAAHDYANLDASLKSKLETIASSFTSLDTFSADLFLGFMAKEINNFGHNLAKQAGGPDLLCSAALSFIDGRTLTYLGRGDTSVNILNNDGLSRLNDGPGAEHQAGTQLGSIHADTPMTSEVRFSTLNEDDVVVIMTRALADAIATQGLPTDLLDLGEPNSQSICDALLKLDSAGGEDRTLVVIAGPYERPFQSSELSEIKKSVAALESRLNNLVESQQQTGLPGELLEKTVDERIDEKFGRQIAELKDHLTDKPATIDFLELDEKVKSLSTTLAGKAETAELLELQRDVLKLGLAAKSAAAIGHDRMNVNETAAPEAVSTPVSDATLQRNSDTIVDSVSPRRATSFFTTAVTVLVIALGAGFLGGWLSSRRAAARQEIWSVKTAGSEISIRREDGGNGGIVTLNVAQSANATGEQRFSSFADVQRYIEAITAAGDPRSRTNQTNQSPPAANSASDVLTEITVKPGDSLKKLAQLYNVPAEKLMALNPGVKRWKVMQTGQKIFVPSQSPPISAAASPSPEQSAAEATPSGTTEVTVGPGDSLNELARRFNTTAARLKELNPQMNWPRIQTGQKVMVPAPAG